MKCIETAKYHCLSAYAVCNDNKVKSNLLLSNQKLSTLVSKMPDFLGIQFPKTGSGKNSWERLKRITGLRSALPPTSKLPIIARCVSVFVSVRDSV